MGHLESTLFIYLLIDGLGLAHALDTPTFNATWWYMSFAFLLILFLPLLAVAINQIGYWFYPLCILLPLLSGLDMNSNFFRYLPVAVLGMLCAKYFLFEKLSTLLQKKGPLYILFIPLNLILILLLCYCRLKLKRLYLFENLMAVAICFFCYLYLERIPVLNSVLMFLGKHSMNMFLIHTFIRGTISPLHNFSYSPRHPVLIVLLLLVDTAFLSVLIEALKTFLKKINLLLTEKK